MAVQALEKSGFRVVRTRPEMVVSFGGDGTILYSEKLFPSVPKLCVRASKACVKCSVSHLEKYEEHSHERSFYCMNCLQKGLEKIAAGRATVREEPKLLGKAFFKSKGGWKTRAAIALNEVQVHNKKPTHALRCRVMVGERVLAPVFLGDGVIVATPFGASGYFNAVTRHAFSKGFGIAFNNGIRPLAPVFLDDLRQKIRIDVLRRHGWFVADNFAETLTLLEGDYVTVEKAPAPGRFLTV